MVRSIQANVFLAFIAFIGSAELANSCLHWNASILPRFLFYLAIAAAASLLKVSIPGVPGCVSVNFLFVLVGIVELPVPQVVVLAATATFIQCVWRPKARPRFVQVLFSISNIAIAAALAGYVYHFQPAHAARLPEPLPLALAAGVYFLANTFPVALIVALTENRSLRATWTDCHCWTLPYYMVGAAIAEGVHIATRHFGWQFAIVVLPFVYLIFRSYRLYLGRLEKEKRHAEQAAALHLRTIEALSLAIDANDRGTSEHLRRVQVYALEIAREARPRRR